jgi:hypothetical protein
MVPKRLSRGFVFIALACVGCNSGTEAPNSGEVSAREKQLSCGDFDRIHSPIGRLTNNVWNKQAIGGAPYEQCLLERTSKQRTQYGWSWKWPADNDVGLAFPAVVFGWKPWDGGYSNKADLPASLETLGALRLTYDAEIQAQGRSIFSIAMWLTRSGATGPEPNSSDVAADVNVWLDGAAFDPSGQRIAEIAIDGSTYELWHAANVGDASGASAAQWTHIVYRSQDAQHRGSLDLKQFLDDAAERGLLAGSEYVSSIEIGNEVMSGSGKTWINELKLEIER